MPNQDLFMQSWDRYHQQGRIAAMTGQSRGVCPFKSKNIRFYPRSSEEDQTVYHSVTWPFDAWQKGYNKELGAAKALRESSPVG